MHIHKEEAMRIWFKENPRAGVYDIVVAVMLVVARHALLTGSHIRNTEADFGTSLIGEVLFIRAKTQ